ncbi:MAG: peptidase E [Candidatus Moranbacteria bacterium]|nr:peptidase E [Candidatus Moranbacteria bacterium]
MKKIVAIGGGEIGGFGKPIETTELDKQIVKLTKKRNPKVLFLPTASNDYEQHRKN